MSVILPLETFLQSQAGANRTGQPATHHVARHDSLCNAPMSLAFLLKIECLLSSALQSRTQKVQKSVKREGGRPQRKEQKVGAAEQGAARACQHFENNLETPTVKCLVNKAVR